MSEEQKAKEDEVFDQELSMDDLDAAGGCSGYCNTSIELRSDEPDKSNCIESDDRLIYGGNGFPNCAATVEDGSWCSVNDACYDNAVDYQDVTVCSKAWR